MIRGSDCMAKDYPLSPSFPLESQKDRLRAYEVKITNKKHIADLFSSLFPQEGKSDGISIPDGSPFFLWRPNNYRLRIPKIKGLDGWSEVKVIPSSFHMENISKGVITFRVSQNIIIQVGKKNVVIFYSLRKGRQKIWFKVPQKDFDSWVDRKIADIYAMLLQEVSKLGLPLDYEQAVWIKHEDGLKGEEFLDEFVSQGHMIDDTYFKQVYVGNQAHVEFKSPSFMKNYVANRSLEQVAPLIVRELEEIRVRLPESKKILCVPSDDAPWPEWSNYFYDNREVLELDYSLVRKASSLPSGRLSALCGRIHSPVDVLSLEPEIRVLSLAEKSELTDWLFESDFGRGR
jgi:hypothetical protein